MKLNKSDDKMLLESIFSTKRCVDYFKFFLYGGSVLQGQDNIVNSFKAYHLKIQINSPSRLTQSNLISSGRLTQDQIDILKNDMRYIGGTQIKKMINYGKFGDDKSLISDQFYESDSYDKIDNQYNYVIQIPIIDVMYDKYRVNPIQQPYKFKFKQLQMIDVFINNKVIDHIKVYYKGELTLQYNGQRQCQLFYLNNKYKSGYILKSIIYDDRDIFNFFNSNFEPTKQYNRNGQMQWRKLYYEQDMYITQYDDKLIFIPQLFILKNKTNDIKQLRQFNVVQNECIDLLLNTFNNHVCIVPNRLLSDGNNDKQFGHYNDKSGFKYGQRSKFLLYLVQFQQFNWFDKYNIWIQGQSAYGHMSKFNQYTNVNASDIKIKQTLQRDILKFTNTFNVNKLDIQVLPFSDVVESNNYRFKIKQKHLQNNIKQLLGKRYNLQVMIFNVDQQIPSLSSGQWSRDDKNDMLHHIYNKQQYNVNFDIFQTNIITVRLSRSCYILIRIRDKYDKDVKSQWYSIQDINSSTANSNSFLDYQTVIQDSHLQDDII